MESWMLTVIWSLVAVLSLVVELATTALVSIWFTAGGLGALAANLLGLPVLVQFGIFAGISLLLFGTCRQWLEDHFVPAAAESSLIGSEGMVSVPIRDGAGRVKVSGKDWRARSDKDLEAGTPVRVVSLSGVTLRVERLEK